jgi:hypothetical protein
MAGRIVPRETYTRWEDVGDGLAFDYVDETRVRDLTAAGATLVVDGVDELAEPIASVTDGLAHASDTACHANAYTSFSSKPGFPLHKDGHDTLLVQLAGTKRWEVHAPSAAHAVRSGGRPTPDGPPSWAGTLAPGDALLVPAGWWHVGTTECAPSVHITFGLRWPNVRQALQWALAAVGDGALEDPIGSASRDAVPRELLEQLGAFPPALLHAYQRGMTLPRLSVAALSRTGATDVGATDRHLVPRTRRRVSVFDTGREAALLVSGRIVRFPSDLIPVVDEALATTTEGTALARRVPARAELVDRLVGLLITLAALGVET